MNGKLEITFSKPLNFSSGLKEQFNEIIQTSIPLYGESDEINYIRNMIVLTVEPGVYTDPALLKHNYTMTKLSADGMEF